MLFSSFMWLLLVGVKIYRAFGEVLVVDDFGGNYWGIVLVVDVIVIEVREGIEFGSYKWEVDLSGVVWGEGWRESE